MYRAEKKYWQILLSRTKAGPGIKVKQEQEEISRNHVPRLFLGSVNTKYGDFESPQLCPIKSKALSVRCGLALRKYCIHSSRNLGQVFFCGTPCISVSVAGTVTARAALHHQLT